MRKNLDKIDITIRISLGIIALVLYFSQIVPATSGIILISISVVFLLTGFSNFCPIYFIFGISTTNKTKD
jgi:hypothetical protein